MSNNKTIVLLDRQHEGHHLAFMNMFIEVLIKLKYKVVVFFPKPETVKLYLKKTLNEEEFNRLDLREYNEPSKEYNIWGRINFALSTLYEWRYVNKVLKNYEIETGRKIDYVYFSMLDEYLANYLTGSIVDLFFKYQWGGMYFHPKHLRYNESQIKGKKMSISDIDITLTSKKCIGVSVHDEGIIENFKNRISKNVVLFSETADDTEPDLNCKIALEIKERAAGRTVVGMVGLEWHKGGYTLYQLSQLASKEDFFFVFIGIRPDGGYSKEQLEQLTTFYSKNHENCFFYFQPLKEGAEYNAVFCALDIPFLVYNNFASTSNRLTKAAIFRKKVLAANKYCIADDIRKYGLGELVEEQNVEQCLTAIQKIHNDLKSNAYSDWSNYDIYRDKNSVKALENQFSALLNIK